MSNVEHLFTCLGLFSLILCSSPIFFFDFFFFLKVHFVSKGFYFFVICCKYLFQVGPLSFGCWHLSLCKIFLVLNKFLCRQVYFFLLDCPSSPFVMGFTQILFLVIVILFFSLVLGYICSASGIWRQFNFLAVASSCPAISLKVHLFLH